MKTAVLVLIPPNKRYLRRFATEADAQVFYQELKKRIAYKPKHQVYLISPLHPIMPPEGAAKPGKLTWCPYCGTTRKFVRDRKFDILRCSICRVSEEEFYVKTTNHTWSKGGIPLGNRRRRVRQQR